MSCKDCCYYTTLYDTHCMKMFYGHPVLCKMIGEFKANEEGDNE